LAGWNTNTSKHSIKTGMMKELNHNILKAGLNGLPEHVPPSSVWELLKENLEADAAVAYGIQRLPLHEPPSEIWTQIEAKLAVESAHRRPNAHPSAATIHLSRRHYAAAAAIALLLAAWWFWNPGTGRPQSAALAVTQELADDQLLQANAESEDDAFQLVQELCRTQTPVCEQPEFKTLKMELDELTDAKSELREALGSYGDDPELHTQLVRIERERSAVLRQMIAMI